jgi:hypothetical protein
MDSALAGRFISLASCSNRENTSASWNPKNPEGGWGADYPETLVLYRTRPIWSGM